MKRRVVVIENDDAIRVLLMSALEDEGYEPEGAATAGGGVCALLRRPAEAVVIDPFMLGVDPEQLLDDIEQRFEVPVLILSAVPSLRSLAGSGLRAWLGKPFDLEELVDAVRQVAAETTALQRAIAS